MFQRIALRSKAWIVRNYWWIALIVIDATSWLWYWFVIKSQPVEDRILTFTIPLIVTLFCVLVYSERRGKTE